jgi:rhodanese-related sulfurtransferase
MTDSETPEVDVDQLAAAGEAVVVDVREPGEYVQGHVPGAVLMPMGQLPSRMAEPQRSDLPGLRLRRPLQGDDRRASQPRVRRTLRCRRHECLV